jgi:hypothetical protein
MVFIVVLVIDIEEGYKSGRVNNNSIIIDTDNGKHDK